MTNICTKVTVRKRPIKNGQVSLYLDNYLATSPPFSLTPLTTFHSFSADAMKTQSDSNIWLLKYKSDKFR